MIGGSKQYRPIYDDRFFGHNQTDPNCEPLDKFIGVDEEG